MLDSLQQCTSGVIGLFIVAGTRCWWRYLCKRHCFGYCLRPCRPAGRLECVQCCSPKGSMNCNLWLTRVLLVLACTYPSLGSSPTTNQPTCTNCSHTHAFLHNTHMCMLHTGLVITPCRTISTHVVLNSSQAIVVATRNILGQQVS